ncbi:hypothetical protein BK133_00895 [Paenibacillus sp. FSL H8-0548]|uniref:hypothetical protein n=1 Tax=Paenibacillus sp. FSL H8-0548 TaxID=1920422 RepID=UPI00096D303D|nr:hypothetical protein [Paenibacillus sp. FSL H8-0548]OMF38791.1 hypothetical protein BK133_00895 [Paenibacillus sp. FSL H8-0548]
MKHIIMYSGGIGSWMAAKRVVAEHGKENVILLFTDTMIEDEDLYRFLKETSNELGCELVWLKDGRDPWEVFRDVKWIGNSRIAQCSHLLKQKVAADYIKKNYKAEEAVLYVGIDWTEMHRLEKIVEHWAPYEVKSPMTEAPYLSKSDMIRELNKIGIKTPELYELGFSHNNCGGFCVRAGQGHFIHLLKTKPELYKYHEEKEQEMREYLENQEVSILSNSVFSHYGLNDEGVRVAKYTKTPYTLRQLRIDWETGLGTQIDMFDIGGCGCFANYEQAI